jgi:hypothetical protein
MNKSIKIFVIHHKPYPKYQDEIFVPLHVGKKVTKINLDMLSDDTGDNISEKNDNFCELTGMYWVWKNIKTDYVGFCHYRRYFNFNLNDNFEEIFPPKNVDQIFGINDIQEIFNAKKLYELIENFDVILSKKRKLIELNVEDQYKRIHIADDWDVMLNVILKKYPDYKSSIQEVFLGSNEIYPCNMFVMRFDIYCKYMEWLFDILFEVERRITIRQKRVFGFMSERLLNLYVHKNIINKFRIKEIRNLNMYVYLYPVD